MEWETYKETAKAMGREPYQSAEMDAARKIRYQMVSANQDFKSRSGWARRYVDATRFENLQEAAELGRWKNDYKWASQNVHTTYRELRALLGMSEAAEMAFWPVHPIRDLPSPRNSQRLPLPNDIRLHDLLLR